LPGSGSVRIVRAEHDGRFTIIDNDAIRDVQLSFKARGLLSVLLSEPPKLRIDAATMARRFSTLDGRDAVRTGLAELEAHRYIATERERGEGGRFTTVTYVYERPELNPRGQRTSVRGQSRGVNENLAAVGSAQFAPSP
jgi:hypothetical protein